jgi:hypothetical protein
MTASAPKPLTFGEQLELAAQQLMPGYNNILVAHHKEDVVLVIMNRTKASGRLKQMEIRMSPESSASLLPDFCRAITQAMNYRIKQHESNKIFEEKKEEPKKEELPEEDKRG